MRKVFILFLFLLFNKFVLYCETILDEKYYIICIAGFVFEFNKTNERLPMNLQELKSHKYRDTLTNINNMFEMFNVRGYDIIFDNNISFLEVKLISSDYKLSFIYKNNKFYLYDNGVLYREFTWDN